MAPAPIISSFVIVDFQLLASTEIWIPSTVSIFTSIVEIFAVLFEINHAYVDPINITVIINSTNNIALRLFFFSFLLFAFFTPFF